MTTHPLVERASANPPDASKHRVRRVRVRRTSGSYLKRFWNKWKINLLGLMIGTIIVLAFYFYGDLVSKPSEPGNDPAAATGSAEVSN